MSVWHHATQSYFPIMNESDSLEVRFLGAFRVAVIKTADLPAVHNLECDPSLCTDP